MEGISDYSFLTLLIVPDFLQIILRNANFVTSGRPHCKGRIIYQWLL